jgi:hypothetical protein
MEIKGNRNVFYALIGISAVFLIFFIYLFIQLSNAREFSTNTLSYLTLTQKECTSTYKDFSGLSECMSRLIAQLNEKQVLVEAMFVNYYMPSQGKGVLIFKNIGNISYDAAKFRLYHNKNLEDSDGCEIGKTVDAGEVCSLDFHQFCQPGDILSVEYDGATIMKKSC